LFHTIRAVEEPLNGSTNRAIDWILAVRNKHLLTNSKVDHIVNEQIVNEQIFQIASLEGTWWGLRYFRERRYFRDDVKSAL
jgi:hypothetical protein